MSAETPTPTALPTEGHVLTSLERMKIHEYYKEQAGVDPQTKSMCLFGHVWGRSNIYLTKNLKGYTRTSTGFLPTIQLGVGSLVYPSHGARIVHAKEFTNDVPEKRVSICIAWGADDEYMLRLTKKME